MERRRDATELRARQRELDREILARLDERAQLSTELRALLEAQPAFDEAGDRVASSDLEAAASGALPRSAVRAIFNVIHAEMRALERPARVAFVGPEESFGHQVARDAFGSTAGLIEAETVGDALELVIRGRAECAVVPFESSVDGLVQPTITALSASELVIVAEREAPGRYDLVSRTGNAHDIDKVYATAVARAACSRVLARDFPRATLLDVRSPRVALDLAREDHGAAALVPEPAGACSGLVAVTRNVGDAPDLSVRWAVVSARPASRTGNDATAVLFSVDDTPGALFEVLRHFAERGVNLRRLQSRPVRGESWAYLFYVEVSGHTTDRGVVTALEAIRKGTRYLRVLGSFAHHG
ncbi:MAG: ACT domain-containing protein [Polyangiaceae bacterium]|nr:ACT domain-containing protein [Polyangiaceae bacterium]